MNYLILGEPFDGWWKNSRNYRGVHRGSLPEMPEEPVANKNVNDAISLYYNTWDPMTDYVSDLEIAKKIAEMYTKYNASGERFEVVAVCTEENFTECAGKFLGWDIYEAETTSLISFYLDPEYESGDQGKFVPFLAEEKALKSHFEAKLNEFLLFNDLQDAKDFLTSLKEVSNLDGSSTKWMYLNEAEVAALFLVE